MANNNVSDLTISICLLVNSIEGTMLQRMIVQKVVDKHGYKLSIFHRDQLPDQAQRMLFYTENVYDIIMMPLSLPNYYALKMAEEVHLLNVPIKLLIYTDTQAPDSILLTLFDCRLPSTFMFYDFNKLIDANVERIATKEKIDAAIAAVLASAICFNKGNYSSRHTGVPSSLNDYHTGIQDIEKTLPGSSSVSGETGFRKPISIFLSYSHKDEAYKQQLEEHLSLLKREGNIHVWHDREITAGQEWKNEISENLSQANIILLLISASFLASDYCYDLEMKTALVRHQTRSAYVIPIIIRSVDWYAAPFSFLQALPKDGKPVSLWADTDEAWVNVTSGLRKVAQSLQEPSH